MKFNASKSLYTFDLFDTLITRPLKRPSMVFNLLESSAKYRNFLFQIIGFKVLRVFSERVARRLSNSEDISIFDIYRILGWFLKNPSAMLRKELALELTLIYPLKENVCFLKRLLDGGYKCCIVSDMYLPRFFIKKIIYKNIGRNIDFLVSSEEGKTKASGNMFRLVCEKYNISPSMIQHFGDNQYSDFLIPKSLGIDATKLPCLDVAGKTNSFYEVFSLKGKDKYRSFCDIGYSLVGPISIEFAKFIANDAIARGLDRVIFVARDGYLIKEAFDNLNTGIKTSYVRLSRKVLYIPSFSASGNYEKFFEGRVSAEDFFARLGLTCPDELINLRPEKNKEEFISYLENIDFKSIARKEASVLIEYLKENEFHGKVGFVDLGWRASLQDSVQQLLNEECQMHGYYFGTIVRARNNSGFYFQDGKPFSRMAKIFQALPVFEYLFTEPIRSLARIEKSKDGLFYFHYVNDEPDFQIDYRKDIAEGARMFFRDISTLNGLVEVKPGKSLRLLDRLINKYLVCPSSELVKSFSGVGHSEGFGGAKYAEILDSKKKNIIGYRNSYWRAAYISNQAPLYLKIIHRILYSGFGMFILLNGLRCLRIVKNYFK